MWYISGLLFLLLISGIIFLIFSLFRMKKRAHFLDLSNRLLLIQYRYQCNPHAMLNRINSLAALPTRVSSSEMQARLLEFGRRLRRALTYTANLTSTFNEQTDQVNEFVARVSQTDPSIVEIKATTDSASSGWLPLPSLLLVNMVNLIVKSRPVDHKMEVNIHAAGNQNELLVTITWNGISESVAATGISDELIRLQLEFFNYHSDGSLVIAGYRPIENGNPIRISYIESKYVRNYSEA